MTIGIDPAEIAIAVVDRARTGRFAQLPERFGPALRAAVSGETVQVAWAAQISANGPVASVGEPVGEVTDAGLVRVSVPVVCEHGAFTVVMSIDDAGLLHGLRLAPADVGSWQPPDYTSTATFTEQEVAISTGPLAVGGTLGLPRGRGPHPGVVLLSGGGPFDRDATSGANKPLKDLAWGLATQGVAVLRFDKVTYAHPHRTPPDLTMIDEYVPYATAAVHRLQQESNVDAERVFVLGHSMGGKVAPRVATADPSVAGLIVLAGDAQPMQQSAVRVVRYLAALNPGPAAEAAVEAITRQAALVDRADLSRATPAADLPFGLSGAYWLDQRGYDPVATAAGLDLPMLILQGGRDYQVTVEDDLARWKAGLAHRPGVTVRVFAADNHLFFPGAGVSTPAEYDPPQHVDPAVVATVAEWLAAPGLPMSRPWSALTAALRRTRAVFGGVGRPGCTNRHGHA